MNRNKKSFLTIISVAIVGVFAALALTFCGGSGGGGGTALSNAPAGFSFTDANGNAITSASTGDTVQLRDASSNVILQFTIGGAVDFSNVTAGRDASKTLTHFPSAGDKDGLSGTLTMYVPCGATTTQVTVCPQAATLAEIAGGCTGELTLTQAAATSGNYTWDNAATRTGSEDCQVSAAVADFGTGVLGSAAQPTLTVYDFPDVGVCNAGTVDVTGDTFKTALAGATSFTLMHKTYAPGEVPFICGKQGVWDPGDPDAFGTTVEIFMTETIASVFTGNVFICNDGFTFTQGNYGFHDATTFRGEIQFTADGTLYRGRLRFTVTGDDAGKTIASLGISETDVLLTDGSGNTLSTGADVRDLLAASPTDITVHAVSDSTTHITTTGGFICAGVLQ